MRNIENISNIDEIRKEIKSQSEKFNLVDFYLSNENCDEIINSGMGVITPIQMFYCFNFGRHEYLAEKVFESLYDDFYEIYKKNNYDYRYSAIDYGDIIIQLLSKYYSMIWMPDKISYYQLQKLIDFYNDMKYINNYLISKCKREIVIGVCVKGENVKMLNFISDFTSIISMVCDKIKERDEYVIDEVSAFDTKKFKL